MVAMTKLGQKALAWKQKPLEALNLEMKKMERKKRKKSSNMAWTNLSVKEPLVSWLLLVTCSKMI